MLVAAIIKNTQITIGIHSESGIKNIVTLSSFPSRTSDEYIFILDSLFRRRDIDIKAADGVIIGSVCPLLTSALCAALAELTGSLPVIVGPGVKTGLDIKIDHHTQLGADLAANAAAALKEAAPPLIIVDFGDCTTFTSIDQNGSLCGVSITAGLQMTLDSLSKFTAGLNDIELNDPPSVIGKNTSASMLSGTVFGHAAMCDGIISRISAELSPQKNPNIIICGEHAEFIKKYLRTDVRMIPDLTLSGLVHIYEVNQKKSVANRRHVL